MGKKIEKSVYKVVVATVGDYDRMKRKVESGNLTRDQLIDFTRRISAIDHAICAVCEGECDRVKEALLSDIAQSRGYGNSASKVFYGSSATFKRRKSEAISTIASMMGLV